MRSMGWRRRVPGFEPASVLSRRSLLRCRHGGFHRHPTASALRTTTTLVLWAAPSSEADTRTVPAFRAVGFLERSFSIRRVDRLGEELHAPSCTQHVFVQATRRRMQFLYKVVAAPEIELRERQALHHAAVRVLAAADRGGGGTGEAAGAEEQPRRTEGDGATATARDSHVPTTCCNCESSGCCCCWLLLLLRLLLLQQLCACHTHAVSSTRFGSSTLGGVSAARRSTCRGALNE